MGKIMDLNGLNDHESATVFQVIQRDSILRAREQQRLSKIEDELNNDAAKRNILANQKAFNDKYCILCCSAFNFLFNKKLTCNFCKFHVCRNCAFFQDNYWICRVCEKQRFLYLQSCKWQCNKDAKNESNVHFGSAKLFEGFVNHSKIHKSAKTHSIVSSNMNGNCDLSETNGEENDWSQLHNSDQSRDTSETSEDSTLIQVREHIEAMVEGFLGESLDSAHVDKPYEDREYDEFLNKHKEKLWHALLDLTQALYLTMTNKPTINTPTNAHVMLKDLIIKITEDSYRLPNLTKKSTSNNSTEETFDHLHNFSSYEELLATAIINQLIEVRQSRYLNNTNGSNQDIDNENSKSTKYSEISVESDLTDSESVMSYNDPTVIIRSSNFGSRHSLVENFITQEPAYVLQEQIEEITTTKSYSDAEDMSHNEESMYPDLNLNVTQTPLKVPFPEAGVDIVEINIDSSGLNDEDLSEDSGIKLTDLQNWEENWLFKKNKKANKSDIMYGYMALPMVECPVSMLIPNPSQKINVSIGDREIDELSDLSEHNSVGSLEFSDDESEQENLPNQDVIDEALVSHFTTKVSPSKATPAKSKFARNLNKPTIQLSTKVPNFLPIELRNSSVESEGDPCFVLKPGHASVQSNIIVQFCCKAKGTKPLLFAWFKNDTLLKSDNNIRIFQSGEENILQITRTNVEDSAQYSCVVYNHLGCQWCDFDFKVKDSSFLSNKINSMNKRIRKQNFPTKSSHEIKGASPKSTNIPKHEKFEKSTPLVIQRTWAERVAQLKNSNSDLETQDNEDMPSKRGKNDEQSNKQNEIAIQNEITIQIATLRPGTIAEREHKKWESPDIEWKDNPYTSEKINTRIQQRALLSSLSNESSPELKEEDNDEDQDTSFLSYNSKDLSRYKREYYIPESLSKDEALRSFDENEYSNSRYFDMNLTKPDLPEDSDSKMNKSSEDKSESNGEDSAKNPVETEIQCSDSESLLPSVKDLVSKFSVNDETQKLDNNQRKDSLSNENTSNLPKKPFRIAQLSQSNYKVHSLTARSMSKEFRELSHLNISRTPNRVPINANNSLLTQLESEPSSPSTTCSPTNEGYASDESNTSSVVSNNGNLSVAIQQNKTNNGRKFSRSILKRASYWEKRCEQGLISDNSVSEDFPPIEANIED